MAEQYIVNNCYIANFKAGMQRVSIIGAGFSSLSAACYLARHGYNVEVFERNATVGGRARQYKEAGFTFDIGPTWYWMPDIFQKFFSDFGKQPSDYYKLEKLDPAYRVIFSKQDSIKIPGSTDEIIQEFDSREKGAGRQLKKFLDNAAYNYDVAINDIIYRPGRSPMELVTAKTILRAGLFLRSISGMASSYFKDPKLRQIIEFPVLFLGAKPSDIPAFYNFMNHADFGLGTWYPEGGMYSVIEALENLARELGVMIHTNAPVQEITVEGREVTGIKVNEEQVKTDLVVSGADYHHTEQLLKPSLRGYSERYWNKKTFAPSALLFFLGIEKKLENVVHHTLFFDEPFDKHAASIYDHPEWPDAPLFYGSFPSLTDPLAAPKGKETAIFLIPLAPGLEDTEQIRDEYFNMIINRFENLTGQKIRDHISVKRSYSINDFIDDYNSFKGNAYGLANILRQTAFLRPKMKSRKVKGLYFTGQLTVPGPGVPPSLISGKIVSDLIKDDLKI
jgi:phytoene desaturase